MPLVSQAAASSSKRLLKSGLSTFCAECSRQESVYRRPNQISPSTTASSTARKTLRLHLARFQSTQASSSEGSSQASQDVIQTKAFTDMEATRSDSSIEAPSNTEGSAVAEQDDVPHDAGAAAHDSNVPTLDDLDNYRPHDLRLPRPSDSTSSTDFEIYTRKFDRTRGAISRAFNKEQIVGFVKELKLKSNTPLHKVSKTNLIRKVVVEAWGLPDPAEIKAKEKKAKQMHDKAQAEVTHDIPLTEQELFLLLGRMDGRELLTELRHKTKLKLVIHGPPPGSLHARGVSEGIESLKQEWEEVQRLIKTVEVDSGVKSSLRPDLYKTLSLATDTFVAPSPSNPKKVKVTYMLRSESDVPPQKVEAMLKRIALHDGLQTAIPTIPLIKDTEGGSPSYAALPFVARESPNWMISALPLYGLTRVSSVQPVAFRQTDSAFPALPRKDIMNKLTKSLEAVQGQEVSLKAIFGHHLFVNSQGPSKQFTPSSYSDIESQNAKSQSTFSPNCPPGLLNAFQPALSHPSVTDIQRHLAGLPTKSTLLRRLLYLPSRVGQAYHFVRLERDMDATRASGKKDSTSPASTAAWSGTQGKEALVDIALPDSPVDARLSATASSPVTEEIIHQVSEVKGQGAPATLSVDDKTYYLYQDQHVRRTLFLQGLQQPYVDPARCDLYAEKVSDRLSKGSKSTYAELWSKTGLDGLDALLESLSKV